MILREGPLHVIACHPPRLGHKSVLSGKVAFLDALVLTVPSRVAETDCSRIGLFAEGRTWVKCTIVDADEGLSMGFHSKD